MDPRSLAREIAMKMLYAASMGGGETMDEVLEQSEQADTLSGSDKTFLENLVAGVTDRQEELDAVIGKYAQGWALNRLGKVDLTDRKSTRLNSSHPTTSRMPSSA